LPLTPDVDPPEKDWIVEAMRMFEHRHSWARTENPQFPVRAATLELLGRAISEYGKVVD